MTADVETLVGPATLNDVLDAVVRTYRMRGIDLTYAVEMGDGGHRFVALMLEASASTVAHIVEMSDGDWHFVRSNGELAYRTRSLRAALHRFMYGG